MMNHFFAIIGLAIACILWGLLQRWIARIDPDIGNDPHCSCHGSELRDMDKRAG